MNLEGEQARDNDGAKKDARDEELAVKKACEKVIFVIGSTGTGKSKLAIELALALRNEASGLESQGESGNEERRARLHLPVCGGEVVSADSMQVYRGNDISSAKVTEEEMRQVPHHLLSFVSPCRQLLINEFKVKAVERITDISKRGLLPIVAGGTMLWAEALLFENLIKSGDPMKETATTGCRKEAEGEFKEGPASVPVPRNLEKLDSEALYKMLKKLDPLMANRLHPNDTRKVKRALIVYRDSGRKLSDVLSEKRETAYQKATYDACIFWLRCDKKVRAKKEI